MYYREVVFFSTRSNGLLLLFPLIRSAKVSDLKLSKIQFVPRSDNVSSGGPAIKMLENQRKP